MLPLLKGLQQRDSKGLNVVPQDRLIGMAVHLEKSYKFSSLLLNVLFGVQFFLQHFLKSFLAYKEFYVETDPHVVLSQFRLAI
jgi:hypothetical protein